LLSTLRKIYIFFLNNQKKEEEEEMVNKHNLQFNFSQTTKKEKKKKKKEKKRKRELIGARELTNFTSYTYSKVVAAFSKQPFNYHKQTNKPFNYLKAIKKHTYKKIKNKNPF
jgi:hypothetical protein